MRRYNAATWLLDRHVNSGAAERTAYRIDGRSVSYAELLRETWRAQNALRQLDVHAGARVAMIVDDELAFPAWFLGSLRSGVLPVPVPTVASAAAMAAAVAGVGAEVVVVSAAHSAHFAAIAERVDGLRAGVVIGQHAGAAEGSPAVRRWSEFTDHGEAPVAPTASDALAFIIYTAGTTGAAKAVAHKHASPQAAARSHGAGKLAATASDRFLSVPKMFTAFGLGNSLLLPLAAGGCAILDSHRLSPARAIDLIRIAQPTLFFATPRFLAALMEAFPPRQALAPVRRTVTAGEPLPAGLKRRYVNRFGHQVVDGISSAETLHMVIRDGAAMPGWELRLSGQSAEPATRGQLHVRGPSLAAGYWKQGTVIPALQPDGWLATGDVYQRAADGSLAFLGRVGDMITADGTRVGPAEIENVLSEHPDVLEVAVVAGSDGASMEAPVAFMVPRAGHRIDPAAVAQYCRTRLAPAAMPRRIQVVRELRWTATGSVRRAALRRVLADSDSARAEVLTGEEEFPTEPHSPFDHDERYSRARR